MLNLLIGKTVSIAIDNGVIKSKSIIVDATHSKSGSKPLSPIEILKERAKLFRKVIYSPDEDYKDKFPKKNEDDNLKNEITYCYALAESITEDQVFSSYPAVKEKINLWKETSEDSPDHYTISKDKDARNRCKSEDSSFFVHKTHLAITEERIITAAVVTSGEKGDGPQLPQLIEQSRRNGINIDTVIRDGAYSGKENLKLVDKKTLKLV